ncbi:MAG: zinc ribbon domain-containing protein [Bacteroidaceae bacterium]|nr:zinc ribbon domain-containing protein [Bacteroidaceae bacterium]
MATPQEQQQKGIQTFRTMPNAQTVQASQMTSAVRPSGQTSSNAPSKVLQQMQQDFMGAQRCPKCGTVNDPQAMFCENCGQVLRDIVCPHCGSHVPAGLDYCEVCHNYIGTDRCSFCYAPMSVTDDYCQECGSPRKGIVCPTCHSVEHFSFCEHCGTPLTDRARMAQEQAWNVPYAQEIRQLEKEMEQLWRTKPIESKQEVTNRERIRELRDRVMTLLQDLGDDIYVDVPLQSEPKTYLTKDDLKTRIEQKRQQLQKLLDQMEMAAQPNPAKARIQSMACKPHISRLGWRCNYKNALHASPLCCACPQQGGKWVILSGNEENNLVNDKQAHHS